MSFAAKEVRHALSDQLPHSAETLRIPLPMLYIAIQTYFCLFMWHNGHDSDSLSIDLGFGLSSLVNAKPSSGRRLQQKSLAPLSSIAPNSTLCPVVDLKRRQVTSYQSTCGFENGDPNQPRTAQPGFDCRTDTLNGLWGFCPTTVISATDCGLAGNCVDSFACTSGCGIFGNKITTFTWYVIAPRTARGCQGSHTLHSSASGGNHCSSALLTDTSDATYTYIACGASPITDHLLAVSTNAAPVTTTLGLASISPVSILSFTLIPTSTSSLSSSSSSASFSSAFPASALPSGTSSTSGPSASSSSNNAGAIVGGVIGGLALISLVGLALLFLRNIEPMLFRCNPTNPCRPMCMMATVIFATEMERVWWRGNPGTIDMGRSNCQAIP